MTQTAQWQPVIIKSKVTGGRQEHQTEITLFLPAVYLRWDEGSLKRRPKGHSAGPSLKLSCDKGFCFVSYHSFWHVFQLGNILNARKCREAGRKKEYTYTIVLNLFLKVIYSTTASLLDGSVWFFGI